MARKSWSVAGYGIGIEKEGTHLCGLGMRWRGLSLKIEGSLVQASQMT
jgi:hypothetical protein